MADAGSLTPAELARRAGLEERYVEEALGALAAAGIVEYDADTETFELPEAAAHCLTEDASPYFMAGWAQALPLMMRAIPHVADAMRNGGGVDFRIYGVDLVEAIDRMNGPAVSALLTRKWLPVMPDVVERLDRGIAVADVGCGSGAAVVAVAKAFPASEIVGFDIDEASVERARARAESENLTNARFERVAAESMGSEGPFGLIMSFDVIHDMADPVASLRGILASLDVNGTYLMVEPNAGADLAQNLNPLGATFYSISVLHCLPVSLAHGDVGLGTAWGPARAEQLAEEAGFGRFERLPIDNPTNAFYRLGP
jgi:2-polyprenyl-3-methyl-5-hydroxy-6-metoxy-1,4-benzoquinol methylase